MTETASGSESPVENVGGDGGYPRKHAWGGDRESGEKHVLAHPADFLVRVRGAPTPEPDVPEPLIHQVGLPEEEVAAMSPKKQWRV